MLWLWGLFIWERSFLLVAWLHHFYNSLCRDTWLKGFEMPVDLEIPDQVDPPVHMLIYPFKGFCGDSPVRLTWLQWNTSFGRIQTTCPQLPIPALSQEALCMGGWSGAQWEFRSHGCDRELKPFEHCPDRQWLRLNLMAFYPTSQVVTVSSCEALLRPRFKLNFVCPGSLLLFSAHWMENQ